MDLAQIVQYCLSGITVGSVYAIVAIGFNIIYNTTGIINFAQGEFLIVGAMTAISLSHVSSRCRWRSLLAVADHDAAGRADRDRVHPAGPRTPRSCG